MGRGGLEEGEGGGDARGKNIMHKWTRLDATRALPKNTCSRHHPPSSPPYAHLFLNMLAVSHAFFSLSSPPASASPSRDTTSMRMKSFCRSSMRAL